MGLYTLPKLFHPDFALPGQKPVGPVEIDWDNPATAGAKHCISNASDGDLVTGQSVFPWGTSVSGPGYQILDNDPITFDELNLADFTIIYRAGTNNGVNPGMVIGHTTDASHYLWAKAGAGISLKTTLQVGVYNTIPDPALPMNTVVITRKGTTGKIWVDGKYYEAQAQAGNFKVDTFFTSAFGSGYAFDGHLAFVYLADTTIADSAALSLSRDPYQVLKPANPLTLVTSDGATAAITGTAVASITESDIVTGGKTIIITLTGDTWKAAGTGPIGSTADTQAIIDGLDSAQSEGTGWNAEVRDKEVTTAVVRTSATVCTITLTAQAGYDITAQETITVTVPTAALVTGAGAITGAPTFTVDIAAGAFQAAWASGSNTVLQVGL